MDLDIDALRGWIGREGRQSERVSPALVARFTATFNMPAPAEDGDAAPLLIHLCLAPPAVALSGPGPDGHPARGGFLPQVPLPRRMWAGGAFHFCAAIRVGQMVTRPSTIRDVSLKQDRSGALCFVTVDHLLTADGVRVVEERQDMSSRRRNPCRGHCAPASAAWHLASDRCANRCAAVSLFRADLHGQRNHCDTPSARTVEGYPGPVVHRPLQATQLAHFAARLRGAPPARFSFRSLSPIFDDADYALHAVEEGAGMRLGTARPGGPVAMEAQATW